MVSWNRRNGQRSTVKRPGTKEYKANFKNRTNQFFRNGTKAGCSSCGSTSVTAVGGGGSIKVYCKRCGKLVKVVHTSHVIVGNWSQLQISRWRSGVCSHCGRSHFTGTLHNSAHKNDSVLQITCNGCGWRHIWH